MRPSITLNFWAIMILLGCAAGFSLAQEANPEGSYQQTCSDVSIKKGTLYARCQELGLRLVRSPRRTTTDAVVMLTVQTMNYLHDGHHRVAL